MKNGRKWQNDYGLDNWKKPENWLMPCSIRDHYEIFRNSVLPKDAKPEDQKAKEALESAEYFNIMKNYDKQLKKLTKDIWEIEYINRERRQTSKEAASNKIKYQKINL
jgi:hypothetical protein